MKRFPSFNWREVTAHWMPDDPFRWEGDLRMEAHFRSKYDAVAWSDARDIGEIGVRAGYSACAMLQVPWVKSYTGYDNGYDGARYYAHAKERLAGPNRTFVDLDTQKADIARHDFVHIDGDHSFDGTLHDIEMCLRLKVKWILVDDYNDCFEVQRAVNAALYRYQESIFESFHIDEPLRGAVLIRT